MHTGQGVLPPMTIGQPCICEGAANNQDAAWFLGPRTTTTKNLLVPGPLQKLGCAEGTQEASRLWKKWARKRWVGRCVGTTGRTTAVTVPSLSRSLSSQSLLFISAAALPAWLGAESSVLLATRCGAVRCGAMRCDAVRCGAMRCDAVRCGAMRCGAMRCDAMRCGAMRCGAMRCEALPFGSWALAGDTSHREIRSAPQARKQDERAEKRAETGWR